MNARIISQFQYMLLLRGATLRFVSAIRCRCFNTCSSCEEQLPKIVVFRMVFSFNTCSSCEEQHRLFRKEVPDKCFNTCSSCEEQLGIRETPYVMTVFQYMLLLRGATHRRLVQKPRRSVSIHAPLARSNSEEARETPESTFQYMLLLRGATSLSDLSNLQTAFQYMLLLRGATKHKRRENPVCCFNTCSSCEEQLG